MTIDGVVLIEDPLALGYWQQHRPSCARETWSESHFWFAFIIFDACLYLLLNGIGLLFAATLMLLTVALVICVTFRIALVLISYLSRQPKVALQAELQTLRGEDLPIYTILVPLFHEARLTDGIIAALSELDYPIEKLDIKLLLEGDDLETINAVNAVMATIPVPKGEVNLRLKSILGAIDVIHVPPGFPRTKPKACNYGLSVARGQFVVIYDAEDRAEKDQLLKVIAAFRAVDPSVVCIQAKLNYYNPRENFLTRSFALEYTAWFDFVLPGIQYLDGPVPLGGTSNHFKTDELRRLGGWDPYNVTEDCDLGVRLTIDGKRTHLIESTTWEEANTRLGNWMRQRSRWSKGYLQTHLVHTKRSFGLFRKLGFRRTALFYLCITAVPAQQLLNLVCLPIVVAYLLLLAIDCAEGRHPWMVIAGSRDEYRVAWKMIFSGAGEDPIWAQLSILGFSCTCFMLFANLIFIAINLIACTRRGYSDLWPVALMSPFYWLLGSLASWKGAIQLMWRPHYWEKTVHGLSQIEAHIPSTNVEGKNE